MIYKPMEVNEISHEREEAEDRLPDGSGKRIIVKGKKIFLRVQRKTCIICVQENNSGLRGGHLVWQLGSYWWS